MREPQIDPALLEALQNYLAEQDMRQRQGLQDPSQYFMQGRGTQAQSPNFIPADMEDSIPKPEQTSGGAYWDFQGGQQNVNGPGWFQVDETYRPPNAVTGGVVNPMPEVQDINYQDYHRNPMYQDYRRQPMPEPSDYPRMGGGRGFSRGGTPYPEFDMPSLGDLAGGLGDTLGAIGRGAQSAYRGIESFDNATNPIHILQREIDEQKAQQWSRSPLNASNSQAPAKKKGEFSDFFKALKAVKSGNKDVKKSFAELAKQLDSEVSDDAKATGTPTI